MLDLNGSETEQHVIVSDQISLHSDAACNVLASHTAGAFVHILRSVNACMSLLLAFRCGFITNIASCIAIMKSLPS